MRPLTADEAAVLADMAGGHSDEPTTPTEEVALSRLTAMGLTVLLPEPEESDYWVAYHITERGKLALAIHRSWLVAGGLEKAS